MFTLLMIALIAVILNIDVNDTTWLVFLALCFMSDAIWFKDTGLKK